MLGRDGSAGGSEVLVEVALVLVVMLEKFGVLDEAVVVLAMRASAMVIEAPAEHVHLLPEAPTLSHGLGGETVLILGAIVV